ncbi:CPBP family intramembrane metalloprotease, partial [Staphylococcus aureus]|nr:CPBP family intramembrane metalloprotease [Staphylococcus aureus]
CGEIFQPFSVNVPIYVLFIQLIGTALFISLIIHLVNKKTNNGKLFQTKLILSKTQKIYLSLTIIWFLIIYLTSCFPSFISFYKTDLKTLFAATITALSAGFFEEYLIRGYLFNLVQRILNKLHTTHYLLTVTSIITSILFGLLHFTNIGESSLTAIYQQVFYATCLGIFFSAIKIKTNTIYIGAIA